MTDPGLSRVVDLVEGFLTNGGEESVSDYEILPLQKGPMPSTVHAVDGGSKVLYDLPGLIVGAYRVSQVTARDSGFSEVQGDTVVTAMAKGEEEDILSTMGLEGEKELREVAALAVGMERKRMEWDIIGQLISRSAKGEFILVDGNLDPVTSPLRERASALVDTAIDKGVHLVGISKRSEMSVRGLPLIPLLEWRCERECLHGGWYTELPRQSKNFRTFAVHFTSFSEHTFRVDIGGDYVEMALSMLVNLCNDAGYPGYPYPLARAHNIAVMNRSTVFDIKSEMEKCLSGKSTIDLWRCLNRDFHAVLDGGVP